MSQMLTLDRAQDILLEAHGKITQVQYRMFQWMNPTYPQDGHGEPCFCALGLLGFEVGVLLLLAPLKPEGEIWFEDTTISYFWDPDSNEVPEEEDFLDSGIPVSELGDLIGLSSEVCARIADWNDDCGWSFQKIALELPWFWNFEENCWTEFLDGVI